MFSEVEQYIQNEFIILEDVKLLNTTAYYDNWEREIEAIGAKYMVKMPKLEMCGSSGPTCKKGNPLVAHQERNVAGLLGLLLYLIKN